MHSSSQAGARGDSQVQRVKAAKSEIRHEGSLSSERLEYPLALVQRVGTLILSSAGNDNQVRIQGGKFTANSDYYNNFRNVCCLYM